MPTKTSHWIFADTTERDAQLDVVDGDLAYVQADNTLYSYNGSAWSEVGAAGSAINFFEVDAPAATPETEDDDFEGTVLDPKWSTWDEPANLTVTVARSHVKLAKPRVGGINWSGIYQLVPSATFTVTAKVAVQGLLAVDFDMAGLGILGSIATPTTGDLEVLCLQTDNTSVSAGTMVLALNRYTAYNTFGSALWTMGGIVANAVYMRARVNGSDIGWDFSLDGVAWVQLREIAHPQTPEAIVLGVNSHNTTVGPGPSAFFDWVRVVDGTADFDQTPYGRILAAPAV